MSYDDAVATTEENHIPSQDKKIMRWSTFLFVMVIFALVINVAALIYPTIYDVPISISKNSGKDIWNTTASALPILDFTVVIALNSFASVAWLYGLLQIGRLAKHYRGGRIFEEHNAVCFIRLGIALVFVGIGNSLNYPIANLFLYWRGVTPWLGDMPPLFLVQPDYLMAGVFFFVLGKIMRRANELEETNRLII